MKTIDLPTPDWEEDKLGQRQSQTPFSSARWVKLGEGYSSFLPSFFLPWENKVNSYGEEFDKIFAILKTDLLSKKAARK